MNVGNLNFISQNKVVSIDLHRNPVEYGVLKTGQICGSALTRKIPELKQIKGSKYTLPDNLETEPILYNHLYKSMTINLPNTSELTKIWQLKEPFIYISKGVHHELQFTVFEVPIKYKYLYDYSEVKKIVKNVKRVWILIEPTYFYWTNDQFKFLPKIMQDTLIKISQVKVKVPYEEREFKKMSVRTRSKIESKMRQWHSTNVEQLGKESTHFYFFTFTIPTKNFSHEKTVRAWNNFIVNFGRKYRVKGNPVNYLWVAELQSGKRSAMNAESYFKMYQKAGEHSDYYKKRYQEFTDKALTPTNNIHYHMVLDRFYNVKDIQDLWLTCLENQGCSRFTSTGASAQPVKADKIKGGVNAVGQYLAKYVSKNDGELKCQLWHCSRRISKLASSIADCFIQMNKIKQYIDNLNIQTIHYVK